MKKPKQYKPKLTRSKKKFQRADQLNARDKGYTASWDRYRFRFLHHNPSCYACGATKKDGVRMHVDHIETHKGDRELFWKVDNFIPLCHGCHSVVTSKFDRHRVQDLEGKLKWLHEQRILFNIKTQVKVVPFKGEDKT